jgi:hypothetical protein
MRRAFFCFACVVPICVPVCLAQDASTGAIRGTIVDPANRRIVGATLAVANDATGFRYSQISDGTGRFAFQLLQPGDYTARVDEPGMSPQISPTIRVNIGEASEIEFKLRIAGAHESVTVSAEPRAVETRPRGLSALVDEQAILNLPLNGRRFTDLALLTPGVTQDPRGLNSTSNGDLSFGGIRRLQTSYQVDGGDNNNAFFAQARGRYRAPYQFSDEVVKEFRVAPNSVSAESGRSGGAVVNVVTKSGSNKFHGTGFDYLRDTSFDARSAGLNIKPSDRPVNATVVGDANQDGNSQNDRLPGASRNFFVGPDYSQQICGWRAGCTQRAD